MNFKNIHIGKIIHQWVSEKQIEILRICNFIKCTEEEVIEMYEKKDLDSGILLRWSKLLDYDFFRIYTQHLILFSPQENINIKSPNKRTKTDLPTFRKNIYTKEVIDFILNLITSGEKTKKQVILEYKIPKTTLYKWISKYSA